MTRNALNLIHAAAVAILVMLGVAYTGVDIDLPAVHGLLEHLAAGTAIGALDFYRLSQPAEPAA